MLFVFSVAVLITILIAVLLGIYLVSLMPNPSMVLLYLSVRRQPRNVILILSLNVAVDFRRVITICAPRLIKMGSEVRVSVGFDVRKGMIVCLDVELDLMLENS